MEDFGYRPAGARLVGKTAHAGDTSKTGRSARRGFSVLQDICAGEVRLLGSRQVECEFKASVASAGLIDADACSCNARLLQSINSKSIMAGRRSLSKLSPPI